MFLVQVLLPLYDNDGKALPRALFDTVRQELVDRFGGLTAYSRAPARGLWQDGAGVDTDDIVVHEVMAESLERPWWTSYRATLEDRFAQAEIVIRAWPVEQL